MNFLLFFFLFPYPFHCLLTEEIMPSLRAIQEPVCIFQKSSFICLAFLAASLGWVPSLLTNESEFKGWFAILVIFEVP